MVYKSYLKEVIIIDIAVLVLFSLYLIPIKTLQTYQKIELIFKSFAGLAFILISYNLYASSQYNKKIEDNRVTENILDSREKYYLKPKDMMVEYYPESFLLHRSISPDDEQLNNLDVPIFDEDKRIVIQNVLCDRLMYCIKNYLTFVIIDNWEYHLWNIIFIQWFHSPILREYWEYSRINYSEVMQEFVDNIILSADEIIKKRTDGTFKLVDYVIIAKSKLLAK